MARTTTAAQIVDALEAGGVQVNATVQLAIASACGNSNRQLSPAELAEFVRRFKSEAVGNSAARGQAGPVEFAVGVSNFSANHARATAPAVNADTRRMIDELLAAGVGGAGVTASDLAQLGQERVSELHRTRTFQGYRNNASIDGDADGELLRLATAVQTAVRGASTAALVQLGADRLKQFAADLAAAVAAISATSTTATNQAGAEAGSLAGYSLNEFLGG
ncbi:hypothetical protein [Aquabacterium sp. OR-4]|uniref:hypothetical protein n=1 Tax=Aquabacterium sp. OR-4 TaxID=2978127 RepID=UPI0021B1C7BD|nr:hypothetical protein [Aquabacterium sp. OR-4]MDT7836629.1 hypothetical protein [Aquabacterium sp. OR-4]